MDSGTCTWPRSSACRDVMIGKRISAEWRVSCRSTRLIPHVFMLLCEQDIIIEVNMALRWITGVVVFSRNLISRCPDTIPLVSIQVFSTSPDAYLLRTFYLLCVRRGLGTARYPTMHSISASDGSSRGAKYVLQSTDLQVRTPEVRVSVAVCWHS